MLLVAFQLLSVVIEPPLFALADRYPKRGFIAGGLVALAFACVLAGVAPSYPMLLVALLLYGPASGCAVAISEAALIEAHLEGRERERIMLRCALAGWIGDLAAPALLSFAALWPGDTWRAAFLVLGALALGHAVLVWRRLGPGARRVEAVATTDDEAGEPVPMRQALRAALRNRQLVAWSAALLLCILLDEIVVAFGALYLEQRLGAGVHERGVIFACFTIGGATGLVLAEWLLSRVESRRLLMASAALGAIAYAGWLMAPTVPLSAIAMLFTGAFCAAHHPLAKAQAYRALPGQAGMVNAVAVLFTPVELAVPLLLAVVADRFGLPAALALLAAQPLGLLLLAKGTRT